jgi:hypothetical protein
MPTVMRQIHNNTTMRGVFMRMTPCDDHGKSMQRFPSEKDDPPHQRMYLHKKKVRKASSYQGTCVQLKRYSIDDLLP